MTHIGKTTWKISRWFWCEKTKKAVQKTASKYYSPNQRAISRSTDSGESEP